MRKLFYYRSQAIKNLQSQMGRTFNPLSANPTEWLNTLKQFVGNLPTNCWNMFDHFVGLAFKGLINNNNNYPNSSHF